MSNKQQLELTRIAKENRPKLQPWILLEDRDKSYHASHRVTDHDLFDNRLISGCSREELLCAMTYQLRARKSILLSHYPRVIGNRYV